MLKNIKKIFSKCKVHLFVLLITFFMCLGFGIGSDLILANPSEYADFFGKVIFQYNDIVLTRFEMLYFMKIGFICTGIFLIAFEIFLWCGKAFEKASKED